MSQIIFKQDIAQSLIEYDRLTVEYYDQQVMKALFDGFDVWQEVENAWFHQGGA